MFSMYLIKINSIRLESSLFIFFQNINLQIHCIFYNHIVYHFESKQLIIIISARRFLV